MFLGLQILGTDYVATGNVATVEASLARDNQELSGILTDSTGDLTSR